MRPIQITVATYNLYLGADLDTLFLGVDEKGLARRVSDIWAAVEGTHPAERMAAAAAVLAHRLPDVIAVQEAAAWRAGTIDRPRRHDLLESLLEYLAARGTPYRLAVSGLGMDSVDFSARLAARTGQMVEFKDRCALLVREDPAIRVRLTRQDRFRKMIRVPILGESVNLPRAWCAAIVQIEDAELIVFAAHLEAYDAKVRSAQASQLLEQVADLRAERAAPGLARATVVMGDLNSRPPAERTAAVRHTDAAHELEGVDAYEQMVGAGLVDTWCVAADVRGDGATCGQDLMLRNAESELSQRVDFVFTDPVMRVTSAEVIGASQADRTPTGLWPSDHGCLTVGLELPRARTTSGPVLG